MNIKENLSKIRSELPDKVKLIAVSKFHPAEAIQTAYEAGQRAFGENIAQEIREKQKILPPDIEWHFIGHLQINKIKYIAPYIHTIESVDSPKLLSEINKHAQKNDRIINLLLQIHIAKEKNKFGFSMQDCASMLKETDFTPFNNIKICGLMGVATQTDDPMQIKKEFSGLRTFFYKIKNEIFKNDASFRELSMGMSSDYKIAIEEGSTMIRVGSKIFGARNY